MTRESAVFFGVLLAMAVVAVLQRPREPKKPGMTEREKREYMRRNTMLGRLVRWAEQMTKSNNAAENK
ncbi:hypothetical protein ABWH74_001555 [Burkholderia vietnamiensis]|jgi:hypothetical protein|uniref:Uncharacterized protein n=2 Tax=Burkholderia vietnamiensis TaxID=60552 RepID=A0AAW7T0T5_BURVI|nr:hypothetical protein [Burkholderia vietnamiensis]MBR8009392.1 hypothetical protein [Burkholderia vietnamiensis]MBR8190422.1 hypothetical protein [Burkholderia vietnamiensis]MCA8450294.1 hypothetical protein [Burkholderia vietnamiensis]MDN7412067.1 hypothetical protein [Burkholderia vietnamiensis]MDN7795159.1 hypothetical protein [Burkholderia vietnamiensis]